MIPKVIHYCWFGRKPLPPLAQRCIESWRKYLPDYEIKEWNEDNFDVYILPYTTDAYVAEKFAFVSDYARFWVLYKYGGLYFDTDVEVIRPMDDVLARGAFMGFELVDQERLSVNPGLGMAAEPGLQLYQEILSRYKTMSFSREDGSLNPYTMIPMVTELLVAAGLKGDGTIEHIAGIDVYPPDWFNPFDYLTGRLRKTENTRSIHWFAKSWMEPEAVWKVFVKRVLRRIIRKQS